MFTIYKFQYGYFFPFCEFKSRENAQNYFNYLRFGNNTKFILKDDEGYIIDKNYR